MKREVNSGLHTRACTSEGAQCTRKVSEREARGEVIAWASGDRGGRKGDVCVRLSNVHARMCSPLTFLHLFVYWHVHSGSYRQTHSCEGRDDIDEETVGQ